MFAKDRKSQRGKHWRRSIRHLRRPTSSRLHLQIIGLKAQIARDEAQLDGKPLVYPDSSDPDVRKYAALNKSYYDQQVAQYKSQLDSYDAKISETQATVQKYQTDQERVPAALGHRKENRGYAVQFSPSTAADRNSIN